MPTPLAYLLTWTCYGSWLHGDPRGSVDDEHNVFATPFLAPDEPRQAREIARLTHHAPEGFRLSNPMRGVVRGAIIEHAHFRKVALLALSVRTNHVHVVTTPVRAIAPAQVSPGSLAGQFKAWATRRLREQQLIDIDTKVWTHRSSTRYLWDDVSVIGAHRYVVQGQGAPDEFTIDGRATRD